MSKRPLIEAEARWVIYGLGDPSTGLVRYVGCTMQQPPEKRFKYHLSETVKRNTWLGAWLRKVRKLGLRPMFVILESGQGASWSEAEQRWIKDLSANRLCNMTDGGDGCGLQFAPGAEAVRIKRGKAIKAHWNAHPERREEKRDFMTNRMADPAERTASSQRMTQIQAKRWSDPVQVEAHLQQVRDPARRLAQSEKMKALWQDPIYRARREAADANPKTRKRRSEAATLRMQNPKTREVIKTKNIARMADPAKRAHLRQTSKAAWADPVSREKMLLAMVPMTVEHKKKMQDGIRDKWTNDSEFREKQTERLARQSKAIWADPEQHRRHAERWIKVKAAGCRTFAEYKKKMQEGEGEGEENV